MKTLRNVFLSLLIALISLSIIVFVNGPSNVLRAFSSIDGTFILLCFLLWVTSVMGESTVVKLSSVYGKLNIKIADAVEIVLLGRFFNSITPFATGGQPAQIYYMSAKKRFGAAESTGILIVKFLIYQVTITIYGALVLILAYPIAKRYVQHLASLAFVGFAVNSSVVFLILFFSLNERVGLKLLRIVVRILILLKIVKNSEDLEEKMANEVRKFQSVFKNILKFPLRATVMSAFTLVQYVSMMILPYFVYRSLGFHGENPWKIVGMQSILTLFVAFIPTPGGSGAQEGAFYLFYHTIFADSTAAGLIVWRFFSFYLNIIIGSLLLPKMRRSRNAEKKTQTESND